MGYTLINKNTQEPITSYKKVIFDKISGYNKISINEDSSISIKWVNSDYFLLNDVWDVRKLLNLFNTPHQNNYEKFNNINIRFLAKNSMVNLEMKYFVYIMIESQQWNVAVTFRIINDILELLAQFLSHKYKNMNSILDISKETIRFDWVDFLGNKTKNSRSKSDEITNKFKVNFITNIYEFLLVKTDIRDEWIKDIWDVRNLGQFGINYTRSRYHYYANFTKINNKIFRESLKKYIKLRLLSRHKFVWNTLLYYLDHVTVFLNFISTIEPTWNDLNGLSKNQINKYIEYLNVYASKNISSCTINSYISRHINSAEKFLSDIQMYEFEIAPKKNVRTLILPSDKPQKIQYNCEKIKYIPDNVLDQLISNINYLCNDLQLIVYIMLYTGLRISDTLCLKQDCLIQINDKYWIESDIQKTYVKNHRIPIDDKLAYELKNFIVIAKEKTNDFNNPEKFLFCKYNGIRKGNPYGADWVNCRLNIFAKNRNIVDDNGFIYHFKNHAFRHTYAVKLINAGVDIFSVQELLAHSSPEMTNNYVKLMDDTKRKEFEKAVENGAFTFDSNRYSGESIIGKDKNEILNMLWTNYKLEAIDTPYGICLQRANGKCNYAKNPPCLVCNSGSSCRDLFITSNDIPKYKAYIESAKDLINKSNHNNRSDLANDNQELLNLYEKIYKRISEGNIIYERIDRLK